MSINTIAQKTNTNISNSRDYLDDRANVLLKPKSAKGIGGFIFDVPDTETLTLSSDITDHFTESNSFLNDHITRKPISITLSGFVGELVYRTPDGVEGAIQELDNRLETVEAYAGDLTPGAVQTAQRIVQGAGSTVSAINQTLDKTQNIVGALEGEGIGGTLQQWAYESLKALWKSQEVVSVQTPWDYFNSMIIKNITFTQNAESKDITDISVTLKEMRFAELKTVNFDQDLLPPAVQIQESEEENSGQVGEEGRDIGPLLQSFEAGKNFASGLFPQ